MDGATWFPAVLGLIGVLVGAVAAVGTQLKLASAQQKADKERVLRVGVHDVLTHALGISMRANDAMVLAADTGSFHGFVSRALGVVTPLDLPRAFDRMHEEANALHRAVSTLWLVADQRTIELANKVALAATDVVTAHHQPGSSPVRYRLRIALSGHHTRATKQIEETDRALGTARLALTQHARRELGMTDADPWAVADSELDEPRP